MFLPQHTRTTYSSINIDEYITNLVKPYQEIIEMDIPTHITSLGLYSYSGCSNLRRITIPTSITYIPSYCFEHCISLEDITIPTSISYGSKCFHCCSSLSDESKQYIPNDLITFEDESDEEEFEFYPYNLFISRNFTSYYSHIYINIPTNHGFFGLFVVVGSTMEFSDACSNDCSLV